MATRKATQPSLSAAVSKNVRKYAFLTDTNHETLAAHMTSRNFPMKKAAISAITAGRRSRISVDETQAFADIFGVEFQDMLKV